MSAAALVFALSVAVLVTPSVSINIFQYKTEASKGASCGTENKSLGPFYIPNNQCSGVLYNLTGQCDRLELVKVEVTDYAHAKVTIDDSLNSVTVERSPNFANSCPGRARVRAVLGCGQRSSDELVLGAHHDDDDNTLPAV